MNELEAKVVELIEAVEAGMAEHGPEAVGLVLTSVRVDGLQWVLAALAMLLAAGACVVLAQTFRRKHEESDGRYGYDDTRYDHLAFAALGGGAMLAVIGVMMLLTIWEWVAIFHPQLKLAHDLVAKVL